MPLDENDIKQLIAILQKGLSNDKDKPKQLDIEEDDDEESSVMKTKRVKIKKKQSKNKFLSMGVKDLHKEDVEIDKVLNKNPPTPRTRPFEFVDVVCRSCGKRESISPSLLQDSPSRYKCNKCSSSPG